MKQNLNTNQIRLIEADSYLKHGCNITGKLVIADYYEAMQNDPRSGQWANMLPYDYADAALELVKTKYPDKNVVKELDIPDLVCRLEDK